MNKFKVLLGKTWFWIIVSAFFITLFGVLWNITDEDIFRKLAIISFSPLAVLIVVYIVFAWIVNPIKFLIKRIKEKREGK